MSVRTAVFLGEELGAYGFPDGHPFGPQRLAAFEAGLSRQGIGHRVQVLPPRQASRDDLELFHEPGYVDFVSRLSATGSGYLDAGDTPVFPGVFEAAATVVGTVLDATERIASGELRRAFVPVAGLHHAHRGAASGFCVFNDCGVAIEALRRRHGIQRVAYVDIDAHHGDGVFYAFEEDPDVIVADIHEDGRFLFPGTGFPYETGRGAGAGTKLNLPLPPGSGDEAFLTAWKDVEAHVDRLAPQFIIFQCGADSLAGDPLTHLRLSERAHAHATARLCAIADRHCNGRILALGGGGYDPGNIERAWSAVVLALLDEGGDEELPAPQPHPDAATIRKRS